MMASFPLFEVASCDDSAQVSRTVNWFIGGSIRRLCRHANAPLGILLANPTSRSRRSVQRTGLWFCLDYRVLGHRGAIRSPFSPKIIWQCNNWYVLNLAKGQAIAVVMMGVLSESGGVPQKQKPLDVDFCRLVTHPKDFRDQRVRVGAHVETAVIEGGTSLQSPSCERYSVELFVPDQIRSHPQEYPGYNTLDDAIVSRGNIGTIGKSITATFTGTITSQHRRLKLTMDEVDDVEVKVKAP